MVTEHQVLPDSSSLLPSPVATGEMSLPASDCNHLVLFLQFFFIASAAASSIRRHIPILHKQRVDRCSPLSSVPCCRSPFPWLLARRPRPSSSARAAEPPLTPSAWVARCCPPSFPCRPLRTASPPAPLLRAGCRSSPPVYRRAVARPLREGCCDSAPLCATLLQCECPLASSARPIRGSRHISASAMILEFLYQGLLFFYWTTLEQSTLPLIQ